MPAPTTKRQSHGLSNALSGWLMSLPLALILFFFLLLPIVTIVIVSFWGATEYSIYPAFQFDNYEFLLTSPVTYQVFLNTIKYAVIAWAAVTAVTLSGTMVRTRRGGLSSEPPCTDARPDNAWMIGS